MSRDSLIARLWAPTFKDEVSGLAVERVNLFDNSGTSLASTAILVTLGTVPPDRAWFIDTITTQTIPGAAQTVTLLSAQFLRNGIFAGRVVKQPEFALAAATNYSHSWLDVGWMLLPGDVLQVAGNFNAGGVANLVFGAAWGFAIPRANIQGG